MKVELYLEGMREVALVAEFLPKLAAARAEDRAEHDARMETAFEARKAKFVDEAPAEEEKPKRGRAAKPKAEEPAKEPEPAIRATPEDQQPEPVAEEPEVGEVLDDKVYTRQDVKDALAAYADKFGMEQAANKGTKLMGAPRISALPEDPTMFAAAVKALTEAVARG